MYADDLMLCIMYADDLMLYQFVDYIISLWITAIT